MAFAFRNPRPLGRGGCQLLQCYEISAHCLLSIKEK